MPALKVGKYQDQWNPERQPPLPQQRKLEEYLYKAAKEAAAYFS